MDGVFKRCHRRISCVTWLSFQQNMYLSDEKLDEVCIIINEAITSFRRSFARYR